MKCIFCLLDKSADEFTVEHVFPEAIGGSFELKHCVCKKCNSFLGSKVDVHLTDQYLIKMRRFLHHLPGKSGKIPNPFERGTFTGDHYQEIKCYLDDNGKIKDAYLTPSIVKEKLPDGTTKVSVRIDAKDQNKLPEMVNKMIMRSGSKNKMTDENIMKQFKIEEIENSRMHINAEIDISNYKKAFLKIAYELAYYWLGLAYMNDPMARMIRSVILDQADPGIWGEQYKIRGDIDWFNESPIIPFGSDLKTSHIAFCSRSGNDISCYIRIFAVFEGVIGVTERAELYPHFQEKFLEVESLTNNKKELSLLEGLAYLNKQNYKSV